MSNNSLAELYAETDARFAAQTGYRPGHKLDPKDPSDKAMIKVWLDIFAKVKKEDLAGLLALTHTSAVVIDNLGKAAEAHQQVVDHLTAAANTPDPIIKDDHVKAAAGAQNAVKDHTRAAAAAQPIVVSPQVAATAALDALASAGGGAALTAHAAQAVLDANPAHPANGPAAQPAAPELVMTAPPAVPTPPKTIEDHVALHQTQSAPGHAIAVHENAGKPPQGGFVPPVIVIRPPRGPAPAPIQTADSTPAPAPPAAPAPEKRSWLREHAELLAVGGTLAVGFGVAIMMGGPSKPRRRATSVRTVRVVKAAR